MSFEFMSPFEISFSNGLNKQLWFTFSAIPIAHTIHITTCSTILNSIGTAIFAIKARITCYLPPISPSPPDAKASMLEIVRRTSEKEFLDSHILYPQKETKDTNNRITIFFSFSNVFFIKLFSHIFFTKIFYFIFMRHLPSSI